MSGASGTAGEVALVAVGALAAAIVCGAPNRQKVRVEIADNSIIDSETRQTLSIDDLYHFAFGGKCVSPNLASRTRSRVITVQSGTKTLELLPTSNISTGELYQQILQLFLTNHTPQLSGSVGKKLNELRERFDGSELTAASNIPPQAGSLRVRGRGIVALGVLCGFAVLAACLVSSPGYSFFVITLSGIAILASVVILLADSRHSGGSQVTPGGIVISPEGIALSTKDLSGEMGWSELKEINLHPSATKPTGLQLKLAGVDILLAEQFSLPLWHLFHQCEQARAHAVMPKRQSTSETGQAADQDEDDILPSDNPYQPPRR